MECGGQEGQAGWDCVSSWLALPSRRVGGRPSCAAPPQGEDRVKPRANKPACLPALKNTGWLDCRVDDNDDDVGKDDEDEEELTPSLGEHPRARASRATFTAFFFCPGAT